MRRLTCAAAFGAAFLVTAPAHAQTSTIAKGCDTNNAGITVPAGFCVGVYAKGLSGVRHMAVAPNGDVYAVSMRGGLLRLRDANNDGKADTAVRVAQAMGSGVWIANNYVYTEIEQSAARGETPAPTIIVR